MLVSLNWLKSHIDLDGYTTAELDDLLTFAGIEVEGIKSSGVPSDKIVVAQIIEAVQHPDADKLKVTKVDAGEGQLRQIVCGAKNYKVGDKVPCCLPGADLGGFVIDETKMRGVESKGMLAAASEIGLTDEEDGLMILPADAEIGKPVKDIFGADTIFELEITPNRPDLLSHYGIARELAALTGRALKQTFTGPDVEKSTDPSLVAIADDAADLCSYYSGRKISGAKVAESPTWLKSRLEAIGLRPINNVVDVTNFVLHELGHPIHAFDIAKLDGGRVIARRATEGETIEALDENTYTLLNSDCVIADASQPAAIAGVTGGEISGVSETTTDILIESAHFNPTAVRATSRRLVCTTDSSYRFERGTDPLAADLASALATQLIVELTGGTAENTLVVAGEAKKLTGDLTIDNDWFSNYLGGVTKDEQSEILTKLGLSSADGSTWTVPSFRLDLTRPIDLTEEIARVRGLEPVPASTIATPSHTSVDDAVYDHTLDLKKALASKGLFEARTIKLISSAQLSDSADSKLRPVALKNPLSEDLTHLRPSLLPGLLSVAARNVAQGASRLPFFETGTTFAAGNEAGDVIESQSFTIILGGDATNRSWANSSPRQLAYEDLRAVLDSILPNIRLKIKPADHPVFIKSADLAVGKKLTVGIIGQINPARLRELDIDVPLFAVELHLSALFELATKDQRRFTELPKFPATTRDIAMDLPRDLPTNRVESVLQGLNLPILTGWTMFDLFTDSTGQKLAADRKSVAYSLTYRDDTRTLKGKEVDDAHAKVLAALEKALDVRFR